MNQGASNHQKVQGRDCGAEPVVRNIRNGVGLISALLLVRVVIKVVTFMTLVELEL